MLRFALALALVAVFAVSSCSAPIEGPADSGPPPQEDAGTDAGDVVPDAGPPPPAIEWVDCPLRSEGGNPVRAECATVQVPLRAGQADGGPTLPMFVKRWAPDGGTRERQLWMLMGGPGGSGFGYEAVAEQIGNKYPDLEFYLPDHRGTGRSSRLGCPDQETAGTEWDESISPNEWPDCLARVMSDHGSNLSAYSTTNAANDLGVLIEKAKQPGQQVFVYGASYGTYWAHRYLQLYPRQADGVILDSLVAQTAASLAEQDSDANEAGRQFFDTVCKADATCSAKLGADPWAFAEATFAKLKMGHCSAFATPYGVPAHLLLRRVFGQVMMGYGARTLIPAAIYRADRCSTADTVALSRLMTAFYGGVPSPAAQKLFELWGWVLSNNVLFSEMWSDPSPTAMDLQASREAAVVSRDVTSGMDALVGKWPTYAKDSYVGAWAVTDTPLLMLAGGLDPATIIRKQRLVKPHFTGANQTWLEFPLGAHGILSSTPTNANVSCGTTVMMSFIRAPTSPVDTTCMSDLRQLDFTGATTRGTTMALFGTMDPWE